MSSSRPVAPRARPVLEHPSYVAPRYHSRLWGRVVFATLVLALCVGIGVVSALYWALHRAQGSSNQVVTVQVRPGTSVAGIATWLERRGMIDNATLFRLDARLQNLGGKLKIGDYDLRRNMSIDQMIAALQVYHSQMISVTIPEGMRKEQIARILQARGISGREFLQESLHPDLHVAILADKPRGATLEGYLFPSTYFVPPSYTGRQFAAYMVRVLDRKFAPSMRADAAAQHRTIFDVLTLASIVEREARVPQERPLIAGVYMNRLRQGMSLYADPTIQYVVGRPGNWWPVLTTDQLRTPSPYNTYLHGGLPPGPIANPGFASIEAALHPQSTPDLYFVAMGNGRHAFERTLAQHNIDACKYQHNCG